MATGFYRFAYRKNSSAHNNFGATISLLRRRSNSYLRTEGCVYYNEKREKEKALLRGQL